MLVRALSAGLSVYTCVPSNISLARIQLQVPPCDSPFIVNLNKMILPTLSLHVPYSEDGKDDLFLHGAQRCSSSTALSVLCDMRNCPCPLSTRAPRRGCRRRTAQFLSMVTSEPLLGVPPFFPTAGWKTEEVTIFPQKPSQGALLTWIAKHRPDVFRVSHQCSGQRIQ